MRESQIEDEEFVALAAKVAHFLAGVAHTAASDDTDIDVVIQNARDMVKPFSDLVCHQIGMAFRRYDA